MAEPEGEEAEKAAPTGIKAPADTKRKKSSAGNCWTFKQVLFK